MLFNNMQFNILVIKCSSCLLSVFHYKDKQIQKYYLLDIRRKELTHSLHWLKTGGKKDAMPTFKLCPSLPESPSSLLVHLCPRCHTIHCHEENFARLDDSEEYLHVMEDVSKNLLLRNAKVNILIIWVWTLMNNPVHVQIEIVKFWNLKRGGKNSK